MTRYPSIIYVKPAIPSRRVRQRRGSANAARVRHHSMAMAADLERAILAESADWEAKIRADEREKARPVQGGVRMSETNGHDSLCIGAGTSPDFHHKGVCDCLRVERIRADERERYLKAQAETGQMVSTLAYDLSEAQITLTDLRADVKALPDALTGDIPATVLDSADVLALFPEEKP